MTIMKFFMEVIQVMYEYMSLCCLICCLDWCHASSVPWLLYVCTCVCSLTSRRPGAWDNGGPTYKPQVCQWSPWRQAQCKFPCTCVAYVFSSGWQHAGGLASHGSLNKCDFHNIYWSLDSFLWIVSGDWLNGAIWLVDSPNRGTAPYHVIFTEKENVSDFNALLICYISMQFESII